MSDCPNCDPVTWTDGCSGNGDPSPPDWTVEVDELQDTAVCGPYGCDAFNTGLLETNVDLIVPSTPTEGNYYYGPGNWPYYYKNPAVVAPDSNQHWDLNAYNAGAAGLVSTPVITGSCYGGSYKSSQGYGSGFSGTYPVSQGGNRVGYLHRNASSHPSEYIIAKCTGWLKVTPGTSGSGTDYYSFQVFMTAGMPNNTYGGPDRLSIGCTAHDGFYYDYADFPAGTHMAEPHYYHMTMELDSWAVEEVYVGCPEGRVWRIKVDVTAHCYVDGELIISTTDRKSISGTNPGYCVIPYHSTAPVSEFSHTSEYLFSNSGGTAYSSHFHMGGTPSLLGPYFDRNIVGYVPPDFCSKVDWKDGDGGDTPCHTPVTWTSDCPST